MKMNDILKQGSALMHRAGFKAKQNSPEILVVTGVVGVIGSIVLACKATTKVSEIQEKAQEQLDAVDAALETHKEEYTEEDAQKDRIIIRAHQAVDYIKLYGPAALSCAASLGCIIGSHAILRKRLFNLGAAYTAIDTAFKKYRENVREKYGDEIDKELRYNVKKIVTEEKVKDENGKMKKVKKETKYIDGELSGYARIFDELNPRYDRNPAINRNFLLCEQSEFNRLGESRGYVFLNEVYEALGFEKTPEGQVVGWIFDSSRPNSDGHISFGISPEEVPFARRGKVEDFLNGLEPAIILDFNVDGRIVDDAFYQRKKARR